MIRKVINFVIKESYINPFFAISIGGIFYYHSIAWGVALLINCLLFHAVSTQGSLKNTRLKLLELSHDFLSEDSQFDMQEVNSEDLQEWPEFNNVVLGRRWFDFLGIQHHPIFKQSLYVFVARRKGLGMPGAAKAYPSTRGPGFIFILKPRDRMSLFDRFVLLHEIEHVSFAGAYYNVQGDYTITLQILNLIVFGFITRSFVTLILIIAYEFLIVREISNFQGDVEILADNIALHKLGSRDEQLEIVSDQKEILTDQLLVTQPKTYTEVAKHREVSRRLKHCKKFEWYLKKGLNPPKFDGSYNWLLSLITFVLFAYWGTYISSPPIILLVLLGLYIIVLNLRFVKWENKTMYLYSYIFSRIASRTKALSTSLN